MSLIVVFSIEAIETFEAIQSQIRERWGQSAVAKFERRTVKIVDTISKSPLIFQSIRENPNIRKGIINRNCSFFYEIRRNRIEVLFFWDNRQEPLL